MREITYAEALNEAVSEEMGRDGDIFLIGEDIGPIGGAFGVYKGLWEKYGDTRVRQTPISEAGFVGLAVGAAMVGLRPVAEIMYMDFITLAMDQIINQAAKLNLMSAGQVKVPLVLRTQCGTGTREAAQHSQKLEAWFVHTPGLKVVMPSCPCDAKGLLKSGIRDDTPVIFIEHRQLYFKKGEVPEDEYLIPFGKVDIKKEGDELTLLTYSYMVEVALETAKELEGKVDVEVIDLRTLVPLDNETILSSVQKTSKVIILQEAPVRGGMAGELLRVITEGAFDCLDAPPRVLGGLNTPIPFSPTLEDLCIPGKEDIKEAIMQMVRM